MWVIHYDHRKPFFTFILSFIIGFHWLFEPQRKKKTIEINKNIIRNFKAFFSCVFFPLNSHHWCSYDTFRCIILFDCWLLRSCCWFFFVSFLFCFHFVLVITLLVFIFVPFLNNSISIDYRSAVQAMGFEQKKKYRIICLDFCNVANCVNKIQNLKKKNSFLFIASEYPNWMIFILFLHS